MERPTKVRFPPGMAGTPRYPNLTIELETMVRALRDAEVLALDIAAVLQTTVKSPQKVRARVSPGGVKEPDHRHRLLLRARRERPPRRPAAEKRDEVAPLHV